MVVFQPITAATGALGSVTLVCLVTTLLRPAFNIGPASLPVPLPPRIAPTLRQNPPPLSPLAAEIEEAGFEEIEVYVTRSQNKFAQYIAMLPILDLCERSVRRPGE